MGTTNSAGPLPPLAIPVHATRFAHGAARSARARQKRSPNWAPRSGENLTTSYSRLSPRSTQRDVTVRAQAVSGRRVAVPAWVAATSDVSLQARADSGHGLSVIAQEQTPAVSPTDSSGVGSTVSRHHRDPARAGGPSLHRSRTRCTGDSVLAKGRAEGRRTLGPCGSYQPSQQGARVAQHLTRHA